MRPRPRQQRQTLQQWQPEQQRPPQPRQARCGPSLRGHWRCWAPRWPAQPWCSSGICCPTLACCAACHLRRQRQQRSRPVAQAAPRHCERRCHVSTWRALWLPPPTARALGCRWCRHQRRWSQQPLLKVLGTTRRSGRLLQGRSRPARPAPGQPAHVAHRHWTSSPLWHRATCPAWPGCPLTRSRPTAACPSSTTHSSGRPAAQPPAPQRLAAPLPPTS